MKVIILNNMHMSNKKYRIIYNENKVIDVFEDHGTMFAGKNTGHMVIVDTIENAKIMLESIDIDTQNLHNKSFSPDIGIDYLDSIDQRIDPVNFLEQ